jgi:FkbM family methyltransferase
MAYRAEKTMNRLLERTGSYLAETGLGRFRLLSSTYYSLVDFTNNVMDFRIPNKKSWMEFEVYEIYVDPTEYVGRAIYIERFHEAKLRDKILQEIEHGDRVVDIGAHIGSTALIFRQAVGKQGEVICFEPNPESFEMLQSTIERNNLDNFKLFNQALGDSNEEIKLEHNSDNTGESSIKGSKKVDKTFNVDLVEAKDKLDSLGEIDWLKIDVEGVEYEIISNLGDDIARFKGLFLELHSDRLLDNEIKQIYEILSSNGLVYTFNGDKVGQEEFIEHAKDSVDFIWKNNSRKS